MQETNSTNNTNSDVNKSITKLLNRDNDKNKYKMFKMPDLGEKPRLVLVGGDGFIINKNPTKEELKSAEKWDFEHNSTETCYRCGESFYETTGHPKREKDTYGNLIGWDCTSCWNKYSSNSAVNKLKLERDCRNNKLDPNSKAGIGYISAVLVRKFLGIEKDCYDISGNFNYPEYDMIEHEDWGKIDAKGSSLFERKDGVFGHKFHINYNEKADFFFCIGFDKNRKHVKAVFIIPNEESISKLEAIPIYYNRYSKYNIFKESELIKIFDDLFHTMKLDNCPVLRRNKEVEAKYDKTYS